MPRTALARRSWRGTHVPPEPAEAGIKEKVSHDLETGASERTPWLLLGGVMLVIAVVAGVIMALSFIAYYLG
jgi:hypothetical protein